MPLSQLYFFVVVVFHHHHHYILLVISYFSLCFNKKKLLFSTHKFWNFKINNNNYENKFHRKKRFTSLPSPAGMSQTKLSLGRNNSVMTSLFPPRESLVVTSRLGKGNLRTFFLQCTVSIHTKLYINSSKFLITILLESLIQYSLLRTSLLISQYN